jgi:V-ATPase subunit C
VPRSSKKVYEDNEYALYTVTLFKRVADNFKVAAREKGFQACLFLSPLSFVFCEHVNDCRFCFISDA